MTNEVRRNSDKFMLRLPDGMRERIRVTADANGRSMNAEIVHTLSEQYPDVSADELANQFISIFQNLPRDQQSQIIEQSRKIIKFGR